MGKGGSVTCLGGGGLWGCGGSVWGDGGRAGGRRPASDGCCGAGLSSVFGGATVISTGAGGSGASDVFSPPFG